MNEKKKSSSSPSKKSPAKMSFSDFYGRLRFLETQYLKKYVVSAVFLLTLVGLAAGIFLIRQRQQLKVPAAGVVDLSLSGPGAPVDPGEEFDVSVLINPNGDTVTATEIQIQFDSTKLEPVDMTLTTPPINPITQGPFFSNPDFLPNCTNTPTIPQEGCPKTSEVSNNGTGDIASAYQGVLCTEAGCAFPTPGPALAVLRLKAKLGTSGTTNINFITNTDPTQPGTRVASLDKTGDQVDTLSGTQVTIGTPTSPTPTLPISPSPTPISPTPTKTPTPVPPSPTPTSIPGSPTPTPTSAPGTGTLNFNIQFQGLNPAAATYPDQTVDVTLRQGTTIVRTEQVVVSWVAATNGRFRGALNNVTPGDYQVLIKGPKHLTRVFPSPTTTINILAGTSSVNWTGTLLLGGDILAPFDTINTLDLGSTIQAYDPFLTQPGALADTDLNDLVNTLDLGRIIDNYFENGEI